MGSISNNRLQPTATTLRNQPIPSDPTHYAPRLTTKSETPATAATARGHDPRRVDSHEYPRRVTQPAVSPSTRRRRRVAPRGQEGLDVQPRAVRGLPRLRPGQAARRWSTSTATRRPSSTRSAGTPTPTHHATPSRSRSPPPTSSSSTSAAPTCSTPTSTSSKTSAPTEFQRDHHGRHPRQPPRRRSPQPRPRRLHRHHHDVARRTSVAGPGPEDAGARSVQAALDAVGEQLRQRQR